MVLVLLLNRLGAAALCVTVVYMSLQKYSTLADNTGGWDGWVAAGLPQEK